MGVTYKKTRTGVCKISNGSCYAIIGTCEQTHTWYIWDPCSGPYDWKGFEELTEEEVRQMKQESIKRGDIKLSRIKARVLNIWNDEKKEVEHDIEIDADLVIDYDWKDNIWFWLEGECPYCGGKIILDLIAKGNISKSLDEEIERIARDEENYTKEEIEDFLNRIETLVRFYTGWPSEAISPAGECIHFNPSEYYSEEEFENMGVDILDVLEVKDGVAIVDINDVVQIFIDKMKR
jgi:hypothetical protein